MTVDRTHVLTTPGMDAHGSYVALSRHRDGMDLHYGRDDFAGRDRLVRTLSRDRAKDMASDYERADPVQSYAERRGITFRERVAEIVRKVVPEKVRGMFDSLRPSADGAPGSTAGERPERESAGVEARRDSQTLAREVTDDPEAVLRRARTEALKRHARAVDAIFNTEDMGGKASPEQRRELVDSRKAFDEVRPHGWEDAEAAYAKDESLAHEAGSGRTGRAVRAFSLRPKSALIRTAAPTASSRAAEARPNSSASIRPAICRVTNQRGRLWETWRRAWSAIRNWSPSSRAASANSASTSSQAAALVASSPSLTASTSAEGEDSDCDWGAAAQGRRISVLATVGRKIARDVSPYRSG